VLYGSFLLKQKGIALTLQTALYLIKSIMHAFYLKASIIEGFYVSVGWGNKLTGKPGFDFRTELGFAIPTQNADVKLIAVDPNNFLTGANLAKEQDEIKDDLNNLRGFITATVTYPF